MVSREIKEPPTYLSSKNKKIRDRIDSRVQPVWMLRVIGFCYIDIILRASCLLSLCGRGKSGSVKDRSLYILSPREGGEVGSRIYNGLIALPPPLIGDQFSTVPPLRHDLNKT